MGASCADRIENSTAIMTFAEVVLRIGVTFVAWLMLYMHLIMLTVVRFAQCPEVSAWRVSMFSGVLALGAAFALHYGHGVRGLSSVFRYFALPLALLVPWAAWIILPYLTGTSFGATHPCDVLLAAQTGLVATGWQRAWAPVQLAVLLAIAVSGWRAWSDSPQRRA